MKKKIDSNVVIYRLGSLGDTICALPCFHQIRKTFCDSNITLLTNVPINQKAAAIEEILGRGYFFNDVLSYPVGTRNVGGIVRLSAAIRRRQIRTLVNLSAERGYIAAARDYLFFKLSGIRKIIGTPIGKADQTPRLLPDGLYESETIRLVNRIKNLGSIDVYDNAFWDLRLTEIEKNRGTELLADNASVDRWIAIGAGTKRQSNDWEESNWGALIQLLTPLAGRVGLILVGSLDEKDRSERIIRCWPGAYVNACGVITPRECAALLSNTDLYVGHDSGPMHLASSVGTKCIAVFSSRNKKGQWFPFGSNHRVFYQDISCMGCRLEECVIERKRCIMSITPDTVAKVVLDHFAVRK